MKFYKKFSDFDLFGYNVGLYFNGNIKEGTLFGIISTIIYILSFIGVTIYYIMEIIWREKITSSSSTFKLEDIVSIGLDKEIFAVNFALQDPITYAEFIDETIYYIKAYHITGKRDPVTQAFQWDYDEIETGPCSLKMFSESNQRLFKDGYKNKYCLYDIDKKNLTGHFIFDHYSQIIISFYPCVNNTENNNHCKPKNIIDYYLNNTYVSMLIQSLTIDKTQIPMIRTFIENEYTSIGQNYFRDYQVFLKIVEIEDDIGILTNNKKYKKILQFDYTMNMFALNHKIYDYNSFCEITIKLSDKRTIYKRKFEKIHNAFSKAGSMMTLIYTLIQLCSWLPVKTVYEINVMNKVFRFDISTEINKKNNKSHVSKHLININNENYFKKNKSVNSELNIYVIKNENEGNNRKIYSKNKLNSNLNKLNIKMNLFNNSKIKRIEDNSGDMLINNILKKRSFSINKNPNLYKESSENNKYKLMKKRKSVESGKHIIDIIKFNYIQLLCYYPIKHCSNDIKINISKNAQKFFRKTMDIISIFRNIITSEKIFKLIMKNQEKFSTIYKEFYYYHKPIISNNKLENNINNEFYI